MDEHDVALPHITYLPPSVTSLQGCIQHEIGVMEKKFQELLDEGDYGGKDDECQQQRLHDMEQLDDALDDGFLCIDLHVLKRKLQIWHDLFSKHNDVKVTPYYAIKCNPDPWLVNFLANSSSHMCPVGFDCASMAELRLAQQQLSMIFALNLWSSENPDHTLIPNTRIVYANPQRAESDLMQAMELCATSADNNNETSRQLYPTQDLWLTLDGVEEISKIAKARDDFIEKHRDQLQMPRLQLIIRIWVPDGHSQVPLGEKFGASLDNIPELVEACHRHALLDTIVGVSFHCGSGCESVETYQEALQMAQQAIAMVEKECNQYKEGLHKCWLLDMGGGFPGVDGVGGDIGRFIGCGVDQGTCDNTNAYSDCREFAPADSAIWTKTTVATIATAIQPTLKSLVRDQQLTLIAEPGRYFVEGAAVLASRIYWRSVSSTDSSVDGSSEDFTRIYKIPHGVQGVFKDVILCNEIFVPQPLRIVSATANDTQLTKLYPSKIIGPSGDPEDVVNAHCMLPELNVGDWLVFDRMGAYTISIASKAGRPVVRYVCGGGLSNPTNRWKISRK